jgi:hypothetical protein
MCNIKSPCSISGIYDYIVIIVDDPLSMLVFWVVKLCELVIDNKVSEEHIASIFRAQNFSIFLRNFGIYPQVLTALQPRTLTSTVDTHHWNKFPYFYETWRVFSVTKSSQFDHRCDTPTLSLLYLVTLRIRGEDVNYEALHYNKCLSVIASHLGTNYFVRFRNKHI